MKILVNGTTLTKGGGVQVAVSFINEAEKHKKKAGIDWRYAISPQIAQQLGELDARFEVFDASPAKSNGARKRLGELQKEISPDAVFTVFGPAYVKFTVPHLLGIADCWLTHSSIVAFLALRSPLRMAKTFGTMVYKGWYTQYAQRWVVEAENARNGLVTRLKRDPVAIDVVPNTCAAPFRAADRQAATFPKPGETLRLLYLTTYYRHKNIELIPHVAAAIRRKQPSMAVKFIITLKSDESELQTIMARAKQLGVEEYIHNNGPVALADAPALYQSAHIAFMPSLLETFSANYPEAMGMGRPLVASDFGFSRTICKNAAVYFKATDADSAADAILRLSHDEQLWQQQISRGFQVLDALPNPEQRYERYVESIQKLLASPD